MGTQVFIRCFVWFIESKNDSQLQRKMFRTFSHMCMIPYTTNIVSAAKELKYRIASNKRPTLRKRLPRINAPLFSHIIL